GRAHSSPRPVARACETRVIASRVSASLRQAGARLSHVRVRAYQPEDFEAAYHLDQACYPPGIAYSRYALHEFFSLPGSVAWVAEEETEMLAFVIVRQVGRKRGHVITLDVREDRRQRGIGRRLLATAETWLRAQGVERVRLEVAVENPAAVAFWQQAGYQVERVLPRYYLGRDDAYRMEKELA
ncbi:MAG: GNAT family N-acetyltransferase, partial [Terriglobia bacterium]